MSDHYDFPDPEEVPTIQTADPEEEFKSKTLFIQFKPDEWPDDQTAIQFIQTFNWMLGPEIQVCILPDKVEALDRDEVMDLLGDLEAQLEVDDDG